MNYQEKLELLKHITLGTDEVLYKNKKWLQNEYWNKEKSTFEICD